MKTFYNFGALSPKDMPGIYFTIYVTGDYINMSGVSYILQFTEKLNKFQSALFTFVMKADNTSALYNQFLTQNSIQIIELVHNINYN